MTWMDLRATSEPPSTLSSTVTLALGLMRFTTSAPSADVIAMEAETNKFLHKQKGNR